MKKQLIISLVASVISASCLAQESDLYSYLCNKDGNTQGYQMTGGTAKKLVMYPGDSLQTVAITATPDQEWLLGQVKPDQVPTDCLSYFLSQGYWQKGQSIARFHFEFNSKSLSGADKAILARLVTTLAHTPNVSVVGHTDSIGSDAYNQNLGEKRAQSVVKLVSSQSKEVSLTTSSRGESQPIGSNSTVQGRALNRRVEIVLDDVMQ
ncbi:OmpA family protein [Vibrio tritonius]|uniref:OmpA family protein n=1 Tax=Vibrio tritonius TaxID=1435069 RepID=UPI00315C53A1